jgi:hypothetical protein
MVVVDLALAVICFMSQCHPALVGNDTPRGTFLLEHQVTPEPGYGGDLLVFREGHTHLWAIHRVYTGVPSERRAGRLASRRAGERRGVTRGCVNVTPEVFDRLVRCCRSEVLVIR